MIDEQKQEGVQIQVSILESKSKPSASTSTSIKNIQNYIHFFKGCKQLEQKEILIQKLTAAGIGYIEEYEQSQIVSFSVISKTESYQAVVLQVLIGPFVIKINLIHIDGSSKIHEITQMDGGSYGKVYFTDFFDNKIAIKCIHLPQNKRKKAFWLIVRQVCFLKIASALQTGPAMKKQLGFDIIMYEECIQFTMELCQNINQVQVSEKDVLKLKEGLLLNHFFHILHLDIKTLNISFSPQFNTLVFIDYGFTSYIKQPFGYKHKTKFTGSPSFCSPQMLKTYGQSKESFIDLYYNDMFCFLKSIQGLTVCNEEFVKHEPQIDMQKKTTFSVTSSLILIKIKSLLMQNNKNQLQKLFTWDNRSCINAHHKQVLDFLMQLKPNSYLKEIYTDYFIDIQKDGIQMQGLKKIYSSSLFQLSKVYNQRKEAIKDEKIQQRKIILNFYPHQNNYHKNLNINFNKFNLSQIFLRHTTFTNPVAMKYTFTRLIEYLRLDSNFYDCTYEEKVQLSKMINTLPYLSNPQQRYLASQETHIQVTFSIFFQFLIEAPLTQWSLSQIATLIRQFCIMGLSNYQQILQLLDRFQKKKIIFEHRLVLYFRLRLCLFWFEGECKVYKKYYDYYKLRDYIVNYIAVLIRKRVVNTPKDETIKMLFLQLFYMEIHYHYSVAIILELAQKFSKCRYLNSNIRQQMKIYLIYKQGQDLNLQGLQTIKLLKQEEQDSRIFYYHDFYCFQIMRVTNNFKVLNLIYEKFRRIIQNPTIIKKYAIYIYRIIQLTPMEQKLSFDYVNQIFQFYKNSRIQYKHNLRDELMKIILKKTKSQWIKIDHRMNNLIRQLTNLQSDDNFTECKEYEFHSLYSKFFLYTQLTQGLSEQQSLIDTYLIKIKDKIQNYDCTSCQESAHKTYKIIQIYRIIQKDRQKALQMYIYLLRNSNFDLNQSLSIFQCALNVFPSSKNEVIDLILGYTIKSNKFQVFFMLQTSNLYADLLYLTLLRLTQNEKFIQWSHILFKIAYCLEYLCCIYYTQKCYKSFLLYIRTAKSLYEQSLIMRTKEIVEQFDNIKLVKISFFGIFMVSLLQLKIDQGLVARIFYLIANSMDSLNQQTKRVIFTSYYFHFQRLKSGNNERYKKFLFNLHSKYNSNSKNLKKFLKRKVLKKNTLTNLFFSVLKHKAFKFLKK